MKEKNNVHLLRSLFLSTFYLSAFTFGGGYVIVTLMKRKFVDELHWIDEDEMLDLVAIAQSAPGAIAVNGAIVVGYKLAGVTGLLTAVLGTVLPPFLILSVISVCYEAFRSMTLIALKAFAAFSTTRRNPWTIHSGETLNRSLVSLVPSMRISRSTGSWESRQGRI